LKILIVGKLGSITHWLEDCAAAWRADGHEVRVAASRDPRVHPVIETVLLDERLGAPVAAAIARRARRFAPDLIAAIGAYHVPAPVLERLFALPGRPPLVGWVGDLFSPDAARLAALLDAVAYTDSGLVALHQRLGFAAPAWFLPHAVNPRGAAAPRRPSAARRDRLVFIANPTDHRRRIVSQIASPIDLYGRGWTPVATVDHHIAARRVPANALRGLYGRHLAALNIRNEHHVLAGLNQRNFDPYLASTPVITDDQGDLARCFDPEREVLVYRDVGELNDLYARLRADPGWAARIGALGRRRVLADHTYARRLAAIAALT
ncbi:MAG: glycosyltransferase family protein, partial [Caulobacteraceae bacterium]